MRSYRIPYVPQGGTVPPSGVLPFVQLQAVNAEAAARHALAVTGAQSVDEPVRLGEVAEPTAGAAAVAFDAAYTACLAAEIQLRRTLTGSAQ